MPRISTWRRDPGHQSSFCARAKALLDRHGVPWTEHVLDGDRARAERLARAFGGATMPYVLLDGEPIGGLSELEALAARGGLGEPRC